MPPIGFVFTYIIVCKGIFVNDIINPLDEIETILYNILEVINMNDNWNNIVITSISVAVYVAPNTGNSVHKNRPFHGFVLNDANSVKDYVFDDGYVMRTDKSTLFYLPKGSSYYVESLLIGGCYAINFDAEISDGPFCVSLRNTERLVNSFKTACDAWKKQEDNREVAAMRALYDAIYQIQRELQRQYVSSDHFSVIAPAVEMLDKNFTQNDLRVSILASLCGISEVYFRSLFFNRFGVSPKEYMIQKRIEYAKALLKSGDFSVTEISMLCGYAEPCHFSREFSRRVGISPKQYVDL